MEKAGIIAFVKMRQVQTDDNYAMRGAALKEAMQVGHILYYTTHNSLKEAMQLGHILYYS